MDQQAREGIEATDERRRYHRVRQVFREACELIAPLILQGFSGAGMSGYALVHMVHDRFPGLSEEELHVLVTAAMRISSDSQLRQRLGL